MTKIHFDVAHFKPLKIPSSHNSTVFTPQNPTNVFDMRASSAQTAWHRDGCLTRRSAHCRPNVQFVSTTPSDWMLFTIALSLSVSCTRTLYVLLPLVSSKYNCTQRYSNTYSPTDRLSRKHCPHAVLKYTPQNHQYSTTRTSSPPSSSSSSSCRRCCYLAKRSHIQHKSTEHTQERTERRRHTLHTVQFALRVTVHRVRCNRAHCNVGVQCRWSASASAAAL